MEVDDFLAHYGKKGMKWGVRKSTKSTHPESDDFKKVKELRRRRPSSLSNQELKMLNERRNLEQNFARLNPRVAKKGESHVKAVLATLGLGASAYQFANSDFGRRLRDLGTPFVDRFLDRTVDLTPVSFNFPRANLTN